MTERPDPAADPRHMLSLARGLAVLEALGAMEPGQRASRVAERTGLARAVVARCLYTLEAAGYVEARDQRFYVLPAALRLAGGYLGERSLPALAQPLLERLRDAVGESTSIGVIDGDSVLYVARAAHDRIVAAGLHVGSRLPLTVSSMGRVLLAALPKEERHRRIVAEARTAFTPRTVTDPDALATIVAQVAGQGFALVDQELDWGLRSIAVPVIDRRGSVVAAMNVGANAMRIDIHDMRDRILPQLRGVAAELGAMVD